MSRCKSRQRHMIRRLLKPCLVLDLDETLVHTNFDEKPPYEVDVYKKVFCPV